MKRGEPRRSRQPWQSYRGSNSRTGPPHSFLSRISPGLNSGPCQRTSPAALLGCRPPQGPRQATPLLLTASATQRALGDHFDARRHPCLLWRCAVASCGTLLLKLVKLGRWSGSARAASRSPSSWPARHPQNGGWSRRGPWTRGPPPDTRAAPRQTGGMVLAAARSGRKPGPAPLTKTSGLRIRGSSRRSHPTPKEGVLVQGFPRVR